MAPSDACPVDPAPRPRSTPAPPAPPTPAPAPPTPPAALRTALLTLLALAAFAANSLLCRAALAERLVDPAAFTAVRIASGALVLVVLVRLRRRSATRAATPDAAPDAAPDAVPDAARARRRDPAAAALLFVYAAGFSYAYLALGAGTGALLLFGSVQVAMFATSIASGARPRPVEWGGLLVALAGLTWLVAPGLTAPPPLAAGLMVAAGLAWGGYTLRGRGARDPVARTADNFAGAVPAAAALLLGHALVDGLHAAPAGLGLAIASGAVTSGLGYVIWYAALPGLTAVRASLVQLSVPVLTTLAAVPLLGEPITARLLVGGGLVVGGIAAAILGRR